MRKKLRKPHRIKRKKSIISCRFFWLSLLIFVIIGTVFYFLFFSEIFQVKEIVITGEKKVLKQELESFMEKRLENKILFYKTKSIFVVGLNEIKKGILDSFPQIAEVEIKRVLPNTLNVVVTERLGLAIWCWEDNCFFLDNEGVLFEEVRLRTELIKIIDEQNTNSFAFGERVIEKEKLSQILKIESELKNGLKIPLEEIRIVSENRLNVKTKEGWEIYFSLKEDLDWQLTRLKLVLLEKEVPFQIREELQYIDLRFEKVYYK